MCASVISASCWSGAMVQFVADQIGRSVKYVYDRMKLLELAKPAKDLFDGKTLNGWVGTDSETPVQASWRIEDESVISVPGSGRSGLMTEGQYLYFELRFEWKVSKGCNSGVYYRPGQVEYQILDNSRHPDGKNPGDVWGDIKQLTYKSKELVSRELLNTIQKPEKLMERIIKASSNPGDLVFDPFCGSGTVPVVCQRLGRRFVACEINADYCRIAEERMVKANDDDEASENLFEFSTVGRNGQPVTSQACLV
jgi:hypothetical protein